MNIQLKRGHLQNANIYSSAAGEYTLGRKLQYRIYKSDLDKYIDFNDTSLPRLKQEYRKQGKYLTPVGIQNPGVKIAPDELLSLGYRVDPNQLNYLSREEIRSRTGVKLPDSELLTAIHYYFMERLRSHPDIEKGDVDTKFTRWLDESALLAIGSVIEGWIEEFCENGGFKAYSIPTEDAEVEGLLGFKKGDVNKHVVENGIKKKRARIRSIVERRRKEKRLADNKKWYEMKKLRVKAAKLKKQELQKRKAEQAIESDAESSEYSENSGNEDSKIVSDADSESDD